MAEITVDQVKEALQKPEIKTAIIPVIEPDVITAIKAKGISVRTKDEDTALLQNHEKNVIPGLVEQQIKSEIAKIHTKYEEDIFEITGLRKEQDEKAYVFNKRILKDLKEKVAKAEKAGDQVLKDELLSLQAKLKGYEGFVSPDEVSKLKENFHKEKLTLSVSTALDKKPIAIPAHITDEKQKQTYAANQRKMLAGDFMGRFTVKQSSDGKTVYYEGDKLLTNTADASPMTEEQIIDAYYASYFVPVKGSAGGAGGSAGGGAADPTEASLKTKEQLMTYLQDVRKLMLGSAEYRKEYDRIKKDQGIPE